MFSSSSSVNANHSMQNLVAQNDLPRILETVRAGLDQLSATHEAPQATSHSDTEQEARKKTLGQAVNQGAPVEVRWITENHGIDKNAILTLFQNCFESTGSIAITSDLMQQLSASLSEMGINHQESSKRIRTLKKEIGELQGENQALKAELERVRPPTMEKIDRASSPITPEKRGKYLGKVKSSSECDQFLLSSDGKWIVAARRQEADSLFLFDTADLNSERRFAFGEQEASPIVQAYKKASFYRRFISSDKYLVSSSIKGDIVWELSAPNEPCFVLEKPKDVECNLLNSVSSDGRWLVYASSDEFKLIERTGNSQGIRPLQISKERIPPIFLFHNQWIASAGESTVHLYSLKGQNDKDIQLELKEGKTIKNLRCFAKGGLLTVEYSHLIDRERLNFTRFYSMHEVIEKGAEATYTELSHEGGISDRLEFSEDSEWLASACWEGQYIRIWRPGKRTLTIPYQSFELVPLHVQNIAWRQDENHLALMVQNGASVWHVPLSPAETVIQLQELRASPQSTSSKDDVQSEATSPSPL